MRVRERRPAEPVGDTSAATELSIDCAVRARTTVVTVRGTVEGRREQLADALEAARLIRDSGPIVIDLSGVGRLGSDAMLCVALAVREAERAGRKVTVRL